jgi:hypothetical protein
MLIRNFRRIVSDLDHLAMLRAMGRHLFIVRIVSAPARITDNGFYDAVGFIVGRLHAPKTATGEDCRSGRDGSGLRRAAEIWAGHGRQGENDRKEMFSHLV